MVILNPTLNARKWLTLVAGFFAAISFLAGVGYLAKIVADDLALLDSANSDNIQWTLSQVEVEFLEYDSQLSAAVVALDDDLTELRRRFDVFYSRINTVGKGRLYGGLRENDDTLSALNMIEEYLDDTVVAIDSSDAALRAALPQILKRSSEIRGEVRKLTNTSLLYFANLSDQRRENVARTLGLLALVVMSLIFLLVCLVIYLSQVNARRLERQREILEVNTRIKTIISTSLDAVIVADQHGEILEFNPAAEEIFGYQSEAVLGRKIGDVVVPPEHYEAHQKGMARIKANGARHVVGKGRTKLDGMRSNGEVFPVEMALQSAQTDEGELFIAFLRDISVLVAAEAELVSARDRALAGEKAKSEFLAVMSHEIRTPLNGLLGNLTLLQDTQMSASQQSYLRNMETSGRLLLSHVTDVLDITRYDAGGMERKLRPMRLDPFLQDLIDNQTGQAEVQNTELAWQWVGPPVPVVESDPDLLQPILLNLISNAVKFTRDGSVNVEAEVIDETDTTSEIEFRVIDTGIGMTEEVRAKVFDDFVTGSAAYNREAGGTGLGLGIAKRFTSVLGGKIGCESEPGEGSIFWVRLRFQKGAALETSEDLKDPLQMQPKNILVVEDNPINRQVVREMLHSMGHTVCEASHGKAGVERAAETKYDLILMDVSMPVMDGEEATRAIRAGQGKSALTPIVALTAHVMDGDREKFLAGGMDDILTKPLSRNALMDAVQNPKGQSLVPDDPISSPDTTEYIDREQLTEIQEAMGQDGYDEMMEMYLVEGDEFIDWLDAGSDHPNDEMAKRAHKFSGSSAVFGAKMMHAQLKHVEAVAMKNDTAEVQKTIEPLVEMWVKTKDNIKTIDLS